MSASDEVIVNCDFALEIAIAKLRSDFETHKFIRLTFERGRKRTKTQNASLHLWLSMLSDDMNSAGLDMKKVLKPEVDIPWTLPAAKEFLWRPIQKAMLQKQSTTQADRDELNPIFETICRHLASKFGFIAPPWPEKKSKEAA